jgi:hypothetical protein
MGNVEAWRTSSYSGTSGGNCVEVASADGVMVRDTTNREGGALVFTAEMWQEFIGGLKAA